MDDMTYLQATEYAKGLEQESRTLGELLQRMAKRIADLTEQRNRFWRESLELRKKLDK